MLSAWFAHVEPIQGHASSVLGAHALIVGGDPNGSPTDSPAQRVDPNTTTSPFAGVGSLRISFGADTYIGSATVISPIHILTAGHCVDLTDDGTVDVAPADLIFHLNYGSDLSHSIPARAIYLHPDFTGFGRPSVNDDLAVIELAAPIPAGVPIYPLHTDPFVRIETVTMVGYGLSGDGVNGFTVGPSFSVKRIGNNHADVYIADDEGTAAREVFEFDFDGPHKRTNLFGSPTAFNLTLGNNIEATLGGGDSGGPSFINDGNGNLKIFGVNTFGFGQKAPAPLFGSGGGGIVVAYYAEWIQSILASTPVDAPPTVTLTSPIDGSTVSGIVTVTAHAADDHAVAQVEFFVNGISIGVDTSAGDGWWFDWDTTTYAEDVRYTITAVASDTAGQTASHSVSVTVNNVPDPPPTKPAMYVWEMLWSENRKGSNIQLDVVVDVRSDSNLNRTAEAGDAAAAGASVTLLLVHDSNGDGLFQPGAGDASWSQTATTNSLGQVLFRRNKAPAGNYQARVTSLTHATLLWDMALDAENPDTYSGVPGGAETKSALRTGEVIAAASAQAANSAPAPDQVLTQATAADPFGSSPPVLEPGGLVLQQHSGPTQVGIDGEPQPPGSETDSEAAGILPSHTAAAEAHSDSGIELEELFALSPGLALVV